MGFSLRRWRPHHLLLAWVTYWIVALVVAVGPALASIWRVTRSPDTHGSINAMRPRAPAVFSPRPQR